MTTVLAFLVTIGILITIHEYGHYRVAVACGVKVLRFSIGFGKPLLRWQRGETEFVVAALPLGGYVRMLGERGSEEPIPAAERHRALDNRPLWQRAAVVVAGPAANLLLAVVLYTCINWAGVDEVQPILGGPAAGSLAEAAGLQAGQRVVAVSQQAAGSGRQDDGGWTEIRSMTDLRWQLMQAALDGAAVQLEVRDAGGSPRRLQLDLASLKGEVDTGLLAKVGLPDVYIDPVLAQPKAGGPAQAAGLAAGDRVLAVDGKPVADFVSVSRLVRASVGADGKPRAVVLRVQRAGGEFDIRVQPRLAPASADKQPVALIDAAPAEGPRMTTIRYGVLEGFAAAARQTWNMSSVTLRMLWRIVTLQAPLNNLSGPLTIADYAGRSAQLGLSYYLGFLAVVSVSLGVLNLLPLPILDGGHLMYYLFEGVTGRPISEEWLDRLQRGGLVIMLLVMSLAFYNDVVRYLGQT